jgi:hypothetical protein
VTRASAIRCFQPLIGKRPWRAKLGLGSFLTFEFGQRVRYGKFWHGTWHLWIYTCTWRLDGPCGLLIQSESPRALIERVVSRLTGRRLTAVEIGSRARWTRFEFEDKFVLKCMPFDQEEETRQDPADYWMFFMPLHMVLTARHGNCISIHRSDRVRGKGE